MMVDLSRLTTEQRNPATIDLDQMSPLEIAAVMNQEDKKAVLAVQQVLPQVATAIQCGHVFFNAVGISEFLGLVAGYLHVKLGGNQKGPLRLSGKVHVYRGGPCYLCWIRCPCRGRQQTDEHDQAQQQG